MLFIFIKHFRRRISGLLYTFDCIRKIHSFLNHSIHNHWKTTSRSFPKCISSEPSTIPVTIQVLFVNDNIHISITWLHAEYDVDSPHCLSSEPSIQSGTRLHTRLFAIHCPLSQRFSSWVQLRYAVKLKQVKNPHIIRLCSLSASIGTSFNPGSNKLKS